jgi:hypothetical protein
MGVGWKEGWVMDRRMDGRIDRWKSGDLPCVPCYSLNINLFK